LGLVSESPKGHAGSNPVAGDWVEVVAMPKRKEEAKAQVEEKPEDLEEVIEDIQEASKDIDEIQEDIDEIQEDVEEIKKSQKSLLQRVSARLVPEEFAWDDLAQQIVGAIVLSTPLAVTQEVWLLSQNLDIARTVTIIAVTLLFNILLIYYTKYQIVKEQKVLSFIPLRLFSQLLVSYISAASMLWVFGVIGNEVTGPIGIVKLIIFVGLFANIGAGTADLLK
jgi:uncharacterized membrane protein